MTPSRNALNETCDTMPPLLTWTTEKPTNPGWYWYGADKEVFPIIVAVQKREDMAGFVKLFALFIESLDRLETETLPGQWAGPLLPPT